jgi:hypothetical protein
MTGSNKDNLFKDLQAMIKNLPIDKEQEARLLLNLVMYVTERDQKVFDHAYALGKKVATTRTN